MKYACTMRACTLHVWSTWACTAWAACLPHLFNPILHRVGVVRPYMYIYCLISSVWWSTMFAIICGFFNLHVIWLLKSKLHNRSCMYMDKNIFLWWTYIKPLHVEKGRTTLAWAFRASMYIHYEKKKIVPVQFSYRASHNALLLWNVNRYTRVPQAGAMYN